MDGRKTALPDLNEAAALAQQLKEVKEKARKREKSLKRLKRARNKDRKRLECEIAKLREADKLREAAMLSQPAAEKASVPSSQSSAQSASPVPFVAEEDQPAARAALAASQASSAASSMGLPTPPVGTPVGTPVAAQPTDTELREGGEDTDGSATPAPPTPPPRDRSHLDRQARHRRHGGTPPATPPTAAANAAHDCTPPPSCHPPLSHVPAEVLAQALEVGAGGRGDSGAAAQDGGGSHGNITALDHDMARMVVGVAVSRRPPDPGTAPAFPRTRDAEAAARSAAIAAGGSGAGQQAFETDIAPRMLHVEVPVPLFLHAWGVSHVAQPEVLAAAEENAHHEPVRGKALGAVALLLGLGAERMAALTGMPELLPTLQGWFALSKPLSATSGADTPEDALSAMFSPAGGLPRGAQRLQLKLVLADTEGMDAWRAAALHVCTMAAVSGAGAAEPLLDLPSVALGQHACMVVRPRNWDAKAVRAFVAGQQREASAQLALVLGPFADAMAKEGPAFADLCCRLQQLTGGLHQGSPASDRDVAFGMCVRALAAVRQGARRPCAPDAGADSTELLLAAPGVVAPEPPLPLLAGGPHLAAVVRWTRLLESAGGGTCLRGASVAALPTHPVCQETAAALGPGCHVRQGKGQCGVAALSSALGVPLSPFAAGALRAASVSLLAETTLLKDRAKALAVNLLPEGVDGDTRAAVVRVVAQYLVLAEQAAVCVPSAAEAQVVPAADELLDTLPVVERPAEESLRQASTELSPGDLLRVLGAAADKASGCSVMLCPPAHAQHLGATQGGLTVDQMADLGGCKALLVQVRAVGPAGQPAGTHWISALHAPRGDGWLLLDSEVPGGSLVVLHEALNVALSAVRAERIIALAWGNDGQMRGLQTALLGLLRGTVATAHTCRLQQAAGHPHLLGADGVPVLRPFLGVALAPLVTVGPQRDEVLVQHRPTLEQLMPDGKLVAGLRWAAPLHAPGEFGRTREAFCLTLPAQPEQHLWDLVAPNRHITASLGLSLAPAEGAAPANLPPVQVASCPLLHACRAARAAPQVALPPPGAAAGDVPGTLTQPDASQEVAPAPPALEVAASSQETLSVPDSPTSAALLGGGLLGALGRSSPQGTPTASDDSNTLSVPPSPPASVSPAAVTPPTQLAAPASPETPADTLTQSPPAVAAEQDTLETGAGARPRRPGTPQSHSRGWGLSGVPQMARKSRAQARPRQRPRSGNARSSPSAGTPASSEASKSVHGAACEGRGGAQCDAERAARRAETAAKLKGVPLYPRRLPSTGVGIPRKWRAWHAPSASAGGPGPLLTLVVHNVARMLAVARSTASTAAAAGPGLVNHAVKAARGDVIAFQETGATSNRADVPGCAQYFCAATANSGGGSHASIPAVPPKGAVRGVPSGGLSIMMPRNTATVLDAMTYTGEHVQYMACMIRSSPPVAMVNTYINPKANKATISAALAALSPHLLSLQGRAAVVMVGDFNAYLGDAFAGYACEPPGNQSKAASTGKHLSRWLQEHGMVPVSDGTRGAVRLGVQAQTYWSFSGTARSRPDHVFISAKDAAIVESLAVGYAPGTKGVAEDGFLYVDRLSADGATTERKRASDHLPLVLRLRLQQPLRHNVDKKVAGKKRRQPLPAAGDDFYTAAEVRAAAAAFRASLADRDGATLVQAFQRLDSTTQDVLMKTRNPARLPYKLRRHVSQVKLSAARRDVRDARLLHGEGSPQHAAAKARLTIVAKERRPVVRRLRRQRRARLRKARARRAGQLLRLVGTAGAPRAAPADLGAFRDGVGPGLEEEPAPPSPDVAALLQQLRGSSPFGPLQPGERVPTLKEMAIIRRQLKEGKTPGPSGALVDLLLRLGDDGLALMKEAITRVLERGWEGDMSAATGIAVPKVAKPDPSKPEHYRPIAAGEAMLKVVSAWLRLCLRPMIEPHLDGAQTAFVKEARVQTAVAGVTEVVALRKRQGKALYIAALDVRKAFDTVHRDTLMALLHSDFAVESRLWHLLDAHLAASKVHFGDTDPVHCKSGVVQGCLLSPLLFAAYMDKVARSVPLPRVGDAKSLWDPASTRPALFSYADDLALVGTDPEQLAGAVRAVRDTLGGIRLALNASKCEVLCIAPEPAPGQGASAEGQRRAMLAALNAELEKVGCPPIARAQPDLRYLGFRFDQTGCKSDQRFKHRAAAASAIRRMERMRAGVAAPRDVLLRAAKVYTNGLVDWPRGVPLMDKNGRLGRGQASESAAADRALLGALGDPLLGMKAGTPSDAACLPPKVAQLLLWDLGVVPAALRQRMLFRGLHRHLARLPEGHPVAAILLAVEDMAADPGNTADRGMLCTLEKLKAQDEPAAGGAGAVPAEATVKQAAKAALVCAMFEDAECGQHALDQRDGAAPGTATVAGCLAWLPSKEQRRAVMLARANHCPGLATTELRGRKEDFAPVPPALRMCPRCDGGEPETVQHALWRCTDAARVGWRRAAVKALTVVTGHGGMRTAGCGCGQEHSVLRAAAHEWVEALDAAAPCAEDAVLPHWPEGALGAPVPAGPPRVDGGLQEGTVLSVLGAAALGRMKELGAAVTGDERGQRAACCHMARGAALAGAAHVRQVLADAAGRRLRQGRAPRTACLRSVVARLERRAEAEHRRWAAHALENSGPWNASLEEAVMEWTDQASSDMWDEWHPAAAALRALEERYRGRPGVLRAAPPQM